MIQRCFANRLLDRLLNMNRGVPHLVSLSVFVKILALGK